MIEKLQKQEGYAIDVLSFQSRGMNIFLGMMLGQDGKRFLTVKVGGAGIADLTMDGITAIWNISKADVGRNGVGASITLDGDAQSAMPSTTGGIQDGAKSE